MVNAIYAEKFFLSYYFFKKFNFIQEITKIYQIDLKGGTSQYKPIIKLYKLKKKIIEESAIENENEEGAEHQDISRNNEQGEEEIEIEHNVSQNLNNVEVDNQILNYLNQQHN